MQQHYASYDYYVEEYLCGASRKISDSSFYFYEKQARQQIDFYTRNRLKKGWNITNEVRECCCEIAEFLWDCNEQKEKRNGLTSYSNDGESGSFDIASYNDTAVRLKIHDIIRKHLLTSGLMFLGNYPGE